MDRLSAMDVSFLTNESSAAHMHVGAIMVFEGPPPAYEDLLEQVTSRLHLVPRFRQKLAHPPVETGRPFWVDDPTFNLEYHVRHSALPSPGSEEQLRNMAARTFSQQLDRTKPLWEMWVVEGIGEDFIPPIADLLDHAAPSVAGWLTAGLAPIAVFAVDAIDKSVIRRRRS